METKKKKAVMMMMMMMKKKKKCVAALIRVRILIFESYISHIKCIIYMWTIAIDNLWHPSFCKSISLPHDFMRLCCVNTAELIAVLLAVETLAEPRNVIVLDGTPNFPTHSIRPLPRYFGPLICCKDLLKFVMKLKRSYE